MITPGKISRQNRRRARTQSARFHSLAIESLEERIVLSLPACVDPGCLHVELFPEFDLFGEQIGVVQVYQDPSTVIVDEVDSNGNPTAEHIEPDDSEIRATFGIFDTGASVISFSALDQLLFSTLGTPIEIKVPNGASADAIGGVLTGDVSQPGPVLSDGLHAWFLDPENIFNSGFDLSQAAGLPNTQAFVGTATGSSALPNIIGTPILSPSLVNPQGLAAEIDMLGFELDIGALLPELPEFEGIVLFFPDIQFVAPNTPPTLPDDGSVTDLLRIPLTLWGEDNTADPGDFISVAPNPVQTEVDLFNGVAQIDDLTFLFDTGAQLSVISTPAALALGIDLSNPDTSITVQGAGGTVSVPGFTIDGIELPRDDNSDGVIDGKLQFSNVPVFVLDVIEGLDGILGMNLFNGARTLLYDPYDSAGASLSLSFLTDRLLPTPGGTGSAALDLLSGLLPSSVNVVGGGFPAARLKGSGGWQNPFDRFDIDASGDVTTLDIFELVDHIRTVGQRAVPEVAIPPDAPAPYADVNGDLMIDTLDIFELVDQVRAGVSGEGEQTAATVSLGAIGLKLGINKITPAAPSPESPINPLLGQSPVSPVSRTSEALSFPVELIHWFSLENPPSSQPSLLNDSTGLPENDKPALRQSHIDSSLAPSSPDLAVSEDAIEEIAADVARQWRFDDSESLLTELLEPLWRLPSNS